MVRQAHAEIDAIAARYKNAHPNESTGKGATALPLHEVMVSGVRTPLIVLLGAVGGPKWDDPRAKVRPEQGLLAIRKGLGLFANLRPVAVNPKLLHASPLRPERIRSNSAFVRLVETEKFRTSPIPRKANHSTPRA